jgi:Ca-activated chloride channel homolog
MAIWRFIHRPARRRALLVPLLAAMTAAALAGADPPAKDQPVAGQPPAAQSTGGQPTAGQSAAAQPAAGQPATGQPAAGQPATGQPAATQPASSQPAAAQPAPGPPGAPASGQKDSKKEKEKKLDQKKAIAKLAPKYRAWLELVEFLITKDEKKAFLELEQDYQRDAFIERFWEVRDRGGAPGEFRRRYQARIEEAITRFGRLSDERARIFLLNGPPAGLVAERCNVLLWPIEAWFYRGSERLAGDFVIVFYQVWGAGPFRIWEPAVGLAELFQDSRSNHSLAEVAGGCRNGDAIAGAIAWVSRQGMMGYSSLEAKIQTVPKGPGGEWITSFHSYSTDIPVGAPTLPARLEVSYPGHYGDRTMIEALVNVPVAEAMQLRLADRRSYNLLVTGEVLEAGKLFENFRYKFEFPGGEAAAGGPAGADLPLVVQRPLRPGEYTLILKVEDLNSRKVCRLKQELQVPRVDQAAPAPPPADPYSAQLLAEANNAIGTGENTLKLIAPRGELQTGMMRFDTLVTGHDVSRVTFSLDGKAILTKVKTPYSVELDLGHLPRSRTLLATAYDRAGNQVASDELVINAPAHRFRVRLTEPQRGHRYENSLLARAETDVPEGESIDHVEFYLNERLVATIYQPPWTQPIVLSREALAYVRAVAYTPDGNSTEDLVFVNAPDNNVEQMNVQFVELYASVLDRRGRPVLGLAQKDFAVTEDGVRQTITRFERVDDLPIHAAVVLDTSASMDKSLVQARDAALGFLRDAIRPKDRAAIITFNDHPNIGVKFANDLDTLAGGLAGLKAERGTSLWDTIIFTEFYFNGVKGQRAMLLLTDGRDESSRFTFEDALEDARRAGVTIYTIGLGDDIDKRKLTKLSEETGGRAFFIKSAAELPAIYSTIQEDLRSQYLVAYQSTNTSPDTNFRTVDLKVDKSGVEVKTLHGYYP